MSASPSTDEQRAALAQRQTRVLDDIQRLEARLAHLTRAIARANANAKPQQRKEKGDPAVVASDAKPAKSSSKPNAKGAKPSPSPSPAASASPSPPVEWELPSDEDPSRWWDASTYTADETGVIPRLSALSRERGIDRFRFYRIPEGGEEYYSWPLERRRDALGVPSIFHLCKSVVMQNTRWEERDPKTGRVHACNPRHVLVVVSYAEKLQKEGLNRAVWTYHAEATRRLQQEQGDASIPVLSKKCFNMRLADEAEAVEFTGSGHNAMTPLTAPIGERLPMLLAASLLRLEGGSLALGGGETDVKWRVSIRQLVQSFKPIIADITG